MESNPEPPRPGPWTSPDGRFFWDGQRWAPTPAQRRRSLWLALAIAAGTAAAFVLVMGVLLVIVLGPALVSLARVFRY